MRTSYLLLLPVALSVACSSPKKEAPSAAASHKADHVTLALVPVTECLPLIYARDAGLFEEAGMAVSLELHGSQADCDTALLGTATGGYADGHSPASRRPQGRLATLCALSGGGWGVAASATLRPKGVKDLKERVVGASRGDASEHFLALALKSGGLGLAQVMRPHVGDFRTRASMLENNQLEAAVLPQPYLTGAVASGCKRLYVAPEAALQGAGRLVVNPAKCSKERQALLLKVYNRAVDSLTAKGRRLLPPLLHRYAGVPAAVADTMALPKYEKVRLPDEPTR